MYKASKCKQHLLLRGWHTHHVAVLLLEGLLRIGGDRMLLECAGRGRREGGKLEAFPRKCASCQDNFRRRRRRLSNVAVPLAAVVLHREMVAVVEDVSTAAE